MTIVSHQIHQPIQPVILQAIAVHPKQEIQFTLNLKPPTNKHQAIHQIVIH